MLPALRDTPFVGRERELEAYRKKLQDLRQQKNLLSNLHGLTGMGKTWLAYMLFQQTSETHSCAWLSFEPDPLLPTREAHYQRRSAYEALSDCLAVSPLAGLPHDELGLDSFKVLKQISVAVEVVHHLRPAPLPGAPEENHPPEPFLLIIDGVDQLDQLETLLEPQQRDEFWDFLQDQLIKRLINHQDSLVVCVSQVPIEWSFWELRTSCDTLALGELSREDTHKILAYYQLAHHNSIIYQLTQGHPASIAYLIFKHTEATVGPPLALPNQRSDPQMHARYHEVKRQIAALENPYARELIQFCGVLRYVEYKVIADLLRGLHQHSQWQHPINQREINQALEEWYKHGMILYRSRDAAFALTREIRAVITEDFQQSERIEQFRELCAILCDQYLKRWRERPRTERVYFSEWAYFSLRLTELAVADATISSAHEEVTQWLKEFKTHWQRLVRPVTQDAARAELTPDRQREERKLREFRQGFSEDLDIQALASALGIYGELQQLTLGPDTRWEDVAYHEAMVDALANYLFRERFPRALSNSEQSLLIYIAQRFPEGFTPQKLQQSLQSRPGAFASLSPRQLQAYINLYGAIYAIHYDPASRKFIMNDWLRRFLGNLPPRHSEVLE